VSKQDKIKKLYICSIYCFDLKSFSKTFGSQINKIKDFFDIIVTYCLDSVNERIKYNFTFINTQNIGSDLGGKFATVHYLNSANIVYEYLFFTTENVNKIKE
jgi:hypothetical protein